MLVRSLPEGCLDVFLQNGVLRREPSLEGFLVKRNNELCNEHFFYNTALLNVIEQSKAELIEFFGIVHLSGFGRIMCSRIILEMLRKTDALAEREFEAVVRSKNQRTHSQEDGNPTAMNEIKHVPTIGFCFQANQGRTFSVWVRGFLVCVYCIFSNTNFALIGTTQPDLAHLHDFTLSQMSFALSMFCVGAIIGSPIGSLLSTKFLNHFDIYFGILVAVFGLSILCIPFTPYCYLLSLLYGFQGMCTTMGNVWFATFSELTDSTNKTAKLAILGNFLFYSNGLTIGFQPHLAQ
ncbi:hypothetical protein CAPTEDRAFT_206354 [Capitella teleta]|uniref:Uncharacterized protein n=1 Tax=Capitella teleta TaxID=283909 RepID=R7UC37_CAPTE|nr:hypothetical protein CAPTEDRAFT_206354 [Capitella teleta]|eukprot:ELU03681.1 hypothetical protein CAPTEDRAFT_206354 [Capitella teleta]